MMGSKPPLVAELSNDELVAFCQQANLAYRRGEPIVSDEDYDFIYVAELKRRLPEHPFLQQVETEDSTLGAEKHRLPEVMLSTDKAYSFGEIEQWLERLKKASVEIELKARDINIKATPKLDGFAGYDDGNRLYTRGDGRKGSDISRVFKRGLSIFNNTKRAQGAGEIVVKKSYFEKRLAEHFEHPRNFQASLIKEKALDSFAKQAIDDQAALFVPFIQLPNWQGDIDTLIHQFDTIVAQMLRCVDFDVDGVVFEVTNHQLKQHMGASRKFHRWQIAFKENKEKAQVVVLSVTPQVGRTGKITPVAELEPTRLSGATIHRATAHHYGFVKKEILGEGSVIELTRSGQVIPKIVRVITTAAILDIPDYCPSCQTMLTWQGDFLLCPNHLNCPAQIIQKLSYFFQALGNNDGFGQATIEKLYANGIRHISQIYQQSDFTQMGFGDKTSDNLVQQLARSRTQAIEDWRFLAAFGIERLGFGNCERLLKVYPLAQVFNLTSADIAAIEGFAELSAHHITDGLTAIKPEFDKLLTLGFHLEQTVITTKEHPLLHKTLVFSGTMSQPREAMTKQAKSLGIKVAKSVSGSTDYLVIGEGVGENKMTAAKQKGIKVLTEADYCKQIEPFL